MLDLRKLFIDVFDPQAGETAAVLIDLPHGAIADNEPWKKRRAMAQRWLAALSGLGAERRFDVLPLVSFDATGMNNGQLPAAAKQNGASISLEEMAPRATFLLALTEFSASAPLIGWTRQFPQLRAASMPRVAPEMESTALAADYAQVARSCERLRARLAGAHSAEFEFSSGDEFRFDFRFRIAEVDDGQLHRDAPEPRLINLPSGEAYTAAYEGERDAPSLTSGVLPVWFENEIVRLRVKENRVGEVAGGSAAAHVFRDFLFLDPARCNVAELGLGCNPMARVWGNVLEDEKAGPHIALGRSEHLGGITGPDAFRDARNVWHEDFVYARESPIQIKRLSLVDAAGRREPLFVNGSYVPELGIQGAAV
jgi:leucyl aminopeptidase (aminopeptidase T)